MTDEPDIEIEVDDLVAIPADQVFVLESEARREADRCAADARRAAQARAEKQIAELRAEVETLRAELEKAKIGTLLPTAAMTADEWEQQLDRVVSLDEYTRIAGVQLRRSLRDWIRDDPRWAGKWR